MRTSLPNADALSRPAKALIDSGSVESFDAAESILAAAAPVIAVGPDATSFGHQAALLTVVELVVRTFGQAQVSIPPAVGDSFCVLPGQGEVTVAQTVLSAGGTLGESLDVGGERPLIAIGAVDADRPLVLQVTWDRWVAHADPDGRRLPEGGTVVLAPLAAAALAVAECFKRVQDVPEACYRARSLNLWRPAVRVDFDDYDAAETSAFGPDLRALPASVWFVGLGHLGQSFAWCWRLLPFTNPAKCEVMLHDFDRVSAANRTTGMLTGPGSVGQLKTRVVASALEAAGFRTRLVERRLLPETRRHSTEPGLALIGVDKVEARRVISDVGWTFAVDAGLGAGPVDFTSIGIHTFPGPRASAEVPAWQARGASTRATHALEKDAYRNAERAGADGCGLVQIAETAVAAPFVGVLAACLAIAEPLRVLHGDAPHSSMSFDSGRSSPARATQVGSLPRFAFLPVVNSDAGSAESAQSLSDHEGLLQPG